MAPCFAGRPRPRSFGASDRWDTPDFLEGTPPDRDYEESKCSEQNKENVIGEKSLLELIEKEISGADGKIIGEKPLILYNEVLYVISTHSKQARVERLLSKLRQKMKFSHS